MPSSSHIPSVLCIGDVILDRFMHTRVRRLSPEGPVPVAQIVSVEDVAGGAANVCMNISALGGACCIIGVVGDDPAGQALEAMISQHAGATARLVVEEGRPTTEKTRFIAQGQQLLRADTETASPISEQTAAKVVEAAEAELQHADVVVLSDYAKGVLTPWVIQRIIALAQGQHKQVVVDPKTHDLTRYNGATVITPNGKETFEATGISPDDDAKAVAAGTRILTSAHIDAVLITRAEQGMSLIQRNAPALHIPTHAREVFDVVGAGDTVIATLAYTLAQGHSLPDAARTANVAAGIVVGKSGTATVSQAELEAALALKAQTKSTSSASKIADQKALKTRVREWQRQGLKVGFTNGCFDLLHVGHITLLEFARAHCDRLVVALNSDASVKRLKGPERPITNQGDRQRVIAALQASDAVVLFEEDTPAEIISLLQPDVLVKGADYQISDIVGADVVLARGGQVLTCELIPDRSTSRIVEKLHHNA